MHNLVRRDRPLPLSRAVGDTNGSYRGSRAQKRRSFTATSAATSTTTANATTVPQMTGSAVSAEPIKTATPTRKAIPPTMKTTHETSLRVMIGGPSTPRSSTQIPLVFLPSGTSYICLADGQKTLSSRKRAPAMPIACWMRS
jgi:hypothetical protein